MRLKSLTFQLLSLILGGFIAAALGVFLFTSVQVKEIVNQSQNNLYDEKLDAIINILEESVEKLKKTGLMESHEEGFQRSALKTLRYVYYKAGNQKVYPAILNFEGEIIMHPVLPHKDKSLQNTPYVQEILQLKNGCINYIYSTKEEKWCRFKSFEEWNWIVVFVVPLDIKYANVTLLKNRLAFTLAGVMILVAMLLSIVIAKTVKPISELTQASEAMAAGDLSLSVNIDRRDELGTLAKSFVSMRNSIHEKIFDLDSRNKRLDREISQRKQVEIKLAESERMLNTIIKTVPDIIYRLDAGGIIIFISDAVRQYGYQPETILGKSFIDLVYHEDRAMAKDRINERRTGERSSRPFEVRLLTKDKKGVLFDVFTVSAVGLYSSGNSSHVTFMGTQGIARDITERKDAEKGREKLIKALQKALENVKTLSGLLPICASCKKIRDDKGYWNQIEAHIEKHSNAKFSHGICPQCSDALYGKEDWYIEMKNKQEE